MSDRASATAALGAAELARRWDVVVAGGGNAALVAALSARDEGARVLLLEGAPRALRGGNSRHTRNIRCVHRAADAYNTGSYTFEELWGDLGGIGSGPSDEALAELTVRASESAPAWMSAHGARWQAPLTGTLHLGRTNRFFLGGGKALLNAYYRTAARAAVSVTYDAHVHALQFRGGRCDAVLVRQGSRELEIQASSVVVATGGFEANLDWLGRYWGDAARNYYVRGTPFNDGTVLAALLDAGAQRAGQERGFHSVAIDARSPRFDGGIATRLDCIPFSIVVNRDARRFYDEGEELWPKRYAIWGGNVAGQPGQIAYAVWDAKVAQEFLPPMYGAYAAGTVSELADALGLDPVALAGTVADYNAAVQRGSGASFDPSRLDGACTAGLTPAKSNWAQQIDTPPFFGVPLRPGITFTYLGVAVNADARVLRVDGSRFENVFAAGEIMSGNILSTGYLAGFGMTIGTVWGRIAGREAARHALG